MEDEDRVKQMLKEGGWVGVVFDGELTGDLIVRRDTKDLEMAILVALQEVRHDALRAAKVMKQRGVELV